VREFGELEMAIMDVMWAAESPCVVREVRERLRYDRSVAYTTVMTVMDILYRKGVLQRVKQGRAWRYWPAEQREEHDARVRRGVNDAPVPRARERRRDGAASQSRARRGPGHVALSRDGATLAHTPGSPRQRPAPPLASRA